MRKRENSFLSDKDEDEDKNLARRLFTPLLDEADVDATAPDDALLVVNISLFCLSEKREREREISNCL